MSQQAEQPLMIRLRSVSKLDYEGLDEDSLIKLMKNRMLYTIGQEPDKANNLAWYNALTYVVRDRLLDRHYASLKDYKKHGRKRIYYFSLEFLIGRMLQNNLLSLNADIECESAAMRLGLELEQLREIEPDAALGNGGLGRLAACFLDSMASIGVAGFGYGIRYEYGMFNQRIKDGYQVEHPENWLRYGNPWEIAHPDVLYPVRFYGHVEAYQDPSGRTHHTWQDTDDVMAMAYDLLIPGYRNNRVNLLRLWAAKSSRDFDLSYFNKGNYIQAVKQKTASENLSRVLYPDDTTEMGKTLRLKQEYFFVSAALQDILHQFVQEYANFSELPKKIAIQLNDTHPTIAIPELMRLLMDDYKLEWNESWHLCVNTFSYTNHTLLPEALETWPLSMFENVLPRHIQIIYEINKRFLDEIRQAYPNDHNRIKRMSIIDEENEQKIRMANLAVIGSHAVNGVSKIHTNLIKTTLFRDFDEFYPNKFLNLTNGINPRRWLKLINPDLSKLISKTIGNEWITNLDLLQNLNHHIEKEDFINDFIAIKHENKKRLASLIRKRLSFEVNPNSLFDVQIKRIHEYKRQLLNILHVITLYNRIVDNPNNSVISRTIIISGKAAPGYKLAKLIIKLCNDVALLINNHPIASQKLKLVFIPNYDVSTAGDIIPAADLSQQISMAGTEASGTGNMKLALNGALTIGTLDGANIEILERVGSENMFIFGKTSKQASHLLKGDYRPRDYIHENTELKRVIDQIEEGFFSPKEPNRFYDIVDALTRTDPYLVVADYQAYLDCQAIVEQSYQDQQTWAKKAVANIAAMGYFSSDRTIREYAEHIWKIKS